MTLSHHMENVLYTSIFFEEFDKILFVHNIIIHVNIIFKCHTI